uniref:Transposase Tc1-like domain-containing protein n=1 Tax=Maylandia zebra TaxID=106582 RepID=A0A3P9CAC9_9CICH
MEMTGSYWNGHRKHGNKETSRVQETPKGRCWPGCSHTGGSEAVGTHYIFHTHTPQRDNRHCGRHLLMSSLLNHSTAEWFYACFICISLNQRNRKKQVACYLLRFMNVKVHDCTIRSRLKKDGLFGRVSTRKLLLSRKNSTA